MNDRVTVEKMVIRARMRVGEIVSGRHVLAIQDTTELNFQRHARRTRGLSSP